MDDQILLCKDCKFYSHKLFIGDPMCGKFIDPVNGKPIRSCSLTRSGYKYCGNEGHNFKPKPIKVSWFKFDIRSFYS